MVGLMTAQAVQFKATLLIDAVSAKIQISILVLPFLSQLHALCLPEASSIHDSIDTRLPPTHCVSSKAESGNIRKAVTFKIL